MKVLYVNHTSLISGAERMLLTLLEALPAEVQPAVACPDGPLEQAVRGLGLPVHRLGGTSGSLRLHPRHTPVALWELGRDALAVRRLAARLDADLVHANSIRAGLACVGAARLGGRPVVLYVHDCLPPGRATRFVRRVTGRGSAAILANSDHTRRAFVEPAFEGRSSVVYPPVDLTRFDPSRIDRAEARAELGLEPEVIALGVIAQVTPWKGQDVAIRALAEVRRAHPEARLLIVGSPKFVSGATRYDNPAYARSLERLVEELNLGDSVRFLGEREDVPRALRALDLVLAPSWEEPFGLSVAEAMAMGVPVVATSVGGPSELVAEGETGRLVPPKQPDLWAEAVGSLLANPALRAAMGGAGREKAVRQFGAPTRVNALAAVYRDVVV